MGLTEHIFATHFPPRLRGRRGGKDSTGSSDNGGGGGGGGGGGSTTSSTKPAPTTVIAITTSTAIDRVTTKAIVTASKSGNAGTGNGNPPAGGVQTQPSPPQTTHSSPNFPANAGVGSSTGGDPAATGLTPPVASSSSLTIFIFNNPSNTTVCSSLPFSWTYTGQVVVTMTLSIQGQSPPQTNTATTTSDAPSPTPSTSRILSTNVTSNADTFTWSLVDVKEGWYAARAFDTANKLGISAGSSPFFVAQGMDTSCLLATSTSPIPDPSSRPLGESSSRIPTGDIVGIALGVTAGVIGLIAAFVVPRMRKRERDLLASPNPTKKRRPHLLY